MLSLKTVACILCHRYSIPYFRGLSIAKSFSIKEDSVIKGNKRFNTEKELLDYLDEMEKLGEQDIKKSIIAKIAKTD